MIFRSLKKVVLLALLNIGFAKAQPFFPLGSGTNNTIMCLYADTTNNLLYAGGYFTQAGSIQSQCVSKWNSITWDSTRNQFYSPGSDNPRGIAKLNNEIYIGGAFGFYDTSGIPANGTAKWDTVSNSWVNYGANQWGDVENVYAYNNELYVMGGFDSIGGIYSRLIGKFDGTTWYAFPPLSSGGKLFTAIFYNGELYVGGLYYSTINPNLDLLAKWDGIQWLPVGVGLISGFAWVNDFAIYQGNLIVAGYFTISQGNPGNSIAAWDGVSWSQFGSGANGQIWDVEIYNGELWAGGTFNNAGGMVVSFLAKWDGNQWYDPGANLNGPVHAMAVLGSDLFIAGSFTTANGVTVNRIIRYNPLTGFQSLEPEKNKIEVYPNPTSGTLNIKNFNSAVTLPAQSFTGSLVEVYNTLGKKVKSLKPVQYNHHTELVEVFIGDLPKGLYLIQLKNEAEIIHSQKIILQ